MPRCLKIIQKVSLNIAIYVRIKSVSRQVNFKITKIGAKCQN